METIEFNDYYKDILFSIPLFRDLNTILKKRLIQELDFNLFKIQNNEIIAEQGEACSRLYILLKGELEVNIIDANGNEVLIENIVAHVHLQLLICLKKTTDSPQHLKRLKNLYF